MRRVYPFACAIAILFPLFGTAHASPIIYVASNGATSLPCGTHATPCSTFALAVPQTDEGGEVRCVDQVGTATFQPAVTIAFSISIDCRGVYGAVQRAAGGSFDIGFIIDSASGAGINVTLRGLSISTLESGSAGTVGVDIRKAASVLIQDCTIRGFAGAGIKLSTTAPINLDVFDSTITHNGTSSAGGGISVAPGSGGSARVTLRRVQLDGNFNGLNVDTTSSSATTRVIVSDSMMTNNTNNGINLSTSGPVDMTVERSAISNNLRGIKSLGASAAVRIGYSTITGNGAGVQNLGGSMTSLKNNFITGNGQNGTPLAAATED